MTRPAMAVDSTDSPPSAPPMASPNKRRKVTALTNDHLSDRFDEEYELQRPEAPIEEDIPGSMVCGICLSEGGKSINGKIDSCDHYFCFICIMEWAKVESRCPMCKKRFTSILRLPKLGVFACERIVNVPQRDQIYHLCGNGTTTRSDPYAETRCMECHDMSDENYLLLCDLCDSAAHSYCVGLGHTVPEGDWFCHDCAVSRAEHEKADPSVEAEIHETRIVETERENAAEECVEEDEAADPNISIFDIVRDADAAPPATRVSLPVSPGHGSGSSIADEEAHRNPACGLAVESRARTLQRCRNVQRRIQSLRDNWDLIRDGSLRFSSVSGESSAGNHKRREEDSLPYVSSSNEASRAEDSHVGATGQVRKDPYDTKKAWKMLEMAKTAQKMRSREGTSHFASKAQPINRSNVQVVYLSDQKQAARCQMGSVQNNGGCVMKMKQKQMLQHHETDSKLLKQKQILASTAHSKTELRSSSSSFHEYPSHRKVPVETGSSMTRPAYGDSGFVQKKTDSVWPCSSRLGRGKSVAVNVEREDNDAKTQIQALVKLNLKLLTRRNPLGSKRFKEIARISTHTIMGACGVGKWNGRIRVGGMEGPVCRHGEGGEVEERSEIVADVCKKCFEAFGMRVVRSVMADKAVVTK